MTHGSDRPHRIRRRPKTGPSMPVNAVSETVPRRQLLMLWMERATGIAMCQIAVAVAERGESAYDAVDGAPTGI